MPDLFEFWLAFIHERAEVEKFDRQMEGNDYIDEIEQEPCDYLQRWQLRDRIPDHKNHWRCQRKDGRDIGNCAVRITQQNCDEIDRQHRHNNKNCRQALAVFITGANRPYSRHNCRKQEKAGKSEEDINGKLVERQFAHVERDRERIIADGN